MPVPVRLQLRWYWSGEKETVFSSFFLTASCCCENTRDRGCGARSFDYQWEFSWVLQCLRSEFNTCWNLSNKFSEQLKLCTRYWSEWRDRRRGSIRTINNRYRRCEHYSYWSNSKALWRSSCFFVRDLDCCRFSQTSKWLHVCFFGNPNLKLL